ncbi:MAG: trimeric intracellular cation channel family protein [Candidatus Binatia bacterium]
MVLTAEFQLPVAFDLAATFLFAITGTLAGMRRHYDIIGVFALAFATALGGGLLRDGVFISAGPPVAVTNVYYLPVVMAAVTGTILIGRFVPPIRRILSAAPLSSAESLTPRHEAGTGHSVGRRSGPTSMFERVDLERRLAKTYVTVLSLVDALGLGIYAVVGAEKSLNRGLPIGAAILVGAVNAAGGGLLRDVLTREVPLLFKPGQFYALTAVVGSAVFVALTLAARINVQHAAFVAIGATFLLRLLAIRFDWQSPALRWEEIEK